MGKISFNSTAIVWHPDNQTLLSATQSVNSKTSEFAKNLFSLNNVMSSFFNVQKNLNKRASVLTNTSNQLKNPNSLTNLIGIVVFVSAIYLFNNLESPQQNEPKPKNKLDELKSAKESYNAILSRIKPSHTSSDKIEDSVKKLPDAAVKVYIALTNTNCGSEKLIEAAEKVKEAYSRALRIPQDVKIRESLKENLMYFVEIVDN